MEHAGPPPLGTKEPMKTNPRSEQNPAGPARGDGPGLKTTGYAGGRRRTTRWLLATLSLLLLAAAAKLVIIPQYAGAVEALASLERIFPPLVLGAGLLEFASLAAYSVLTASVLGPVRPSYFTLLRIDLADLSVNHVVPGGGATAAAVRFRLLTRAGTNPAKALAAATIEITVSNLVLGAVFAVGLLLTLSSTRSNDYYRTATVAALAALLATGAGVWFLTRHTDRAVQVVTRVARHMPLFRPDAGEVFLRTMAVQVRQLATSPLTMLADAVLAGTNWLLDAAALWVLLAAFGHRLGVGAYVSLRSGVFRKHRGRPGPGHVV